MPYGLKPECYKCKSEESSMWNTTNEGKLCNECFNKEKTENKTEDSSQTNSKQNNTNQDYVSSKIVLRKSTRSTRSYKTRQNPNAIPKVLQPKGKGRRMIFKKTCIKAPSAVATPVSSDYIFYKGSYLQIGDIVALYGVDGGVYYAQIRGFLTDQYCEKSASISWLLPTRNSPPPEEGFDPSTYILGPDEELARKIECMEFVMHAPSDYFKSRRTPFPPVDNISGDNSFIWTRLPKNC